MNQVFDKSTIPIKENKEIKERERDMQLGLDILSYRYP